MLTDFDKKLEEIINNSDKLYYNYLGINRKKYPKWEGWKIISAYKEQGTDIKDICDERLDLHVRNFYYLKLMETINSEQKVKRDFS